MIACDIKTAPGIQHNEEHGSDAFARRLRTSHTLKRFQADDLAHLPPSHVVERHGTRSRRLSWLEGPSQVS